MLESFTYVICSVVVCRNKSSLVYSFYVKHSSLLSFLWLCGRIPSKPGVWGYVSPVTWKYSVKIFSANCKPVTYLTLTWRAGRFGSPGGRRSCLLRWTGDTLWDSPISWKVYHCTHGKNKVIAGTASSLVTYRSKHTWLEVWPQWSLAHFKSTRTRMAFTIQWLMSTIRPRLYAANIFLTSYYEGSIMLDWHVPYFPVKPSRFRWNWDTLQFEMN